MNLKAILNYFYKYLNLNQSFTPDSLKSYQSYIKCIMKDGGDISTWLEGAIKSTNPTVHLTNKFNNHFSTKSIEPKTLNNRKSALIKLGTFVCGNTHAEVNLQSIKDFNLIACQMVAQSVIFCSKDVFDDVVNGKLGSRENKGKGNKYGSWYNCTTRRFRSRKENKGTIINGIKLDDNTRANNAIKSAVAESLKRTYDIKVVNNNFVGFEACHIWSDSCYDEHYHTSVGNLVLLPRAIAGFSDHCPAVRELLQYEAYLRFGFYPDGKKKPSCPQNYAKLIWRY